MDENMKRFCVVWFGLIAAATLYGQGVGVDSLRLRSNAGGAAWLLLTQTATAQYRLLLPPSLGTNTNQLLWVNGATGQLSLLPPGTIGQILQLGTGGLSWVDLPPLIAQNAWSLSGNSIMGTEFLGTTNNQPLVIRTNNTEQLRVTTSGSVGIGTTSPSALLHVAGTGRFDGVLTADNNLVVNGSATLGDAAADVVTVVAGTVTLQNVPGNSTATDVLVRTVDGNVAYRSASSLLGSTGWSLTGNSGTDPLVNFLGTTDNQPLVIRTNNTEQVRITTGGYVGIGVANPTLRLQLPNIANNDGRARANSWLIYSSMRWKEDIRPIPNALEKALALRGVNYRWKPEYGGTEDIGFLAEEVARVVPEVVSYEPDGQVAGMDYSRLTALLVEALKEEHRRNEELRAELAQLRQLVERVAMQQGINSDGSSINVRVDGDWLGQNVPNPHDGTTTIPCYVPAGVSNAQLVVADVTGQLIRSVTISARNTWTNVTLDMTLLASGTYEYRLVFDGRTVAIKQMQLVR